MWMIHIETSIILKIEIQSIAEFNLVERLKFHLALSAILYTQYYQRLLTTPSQDSDVKKIFCDGVFIT